MTDEQKQRFAALLDDHHDWPDYFSFKFVLKDVEKYSHFEQEFGQESITIRHSKNGKYQSLSCRKLITSSAQVLAVYEKLSKIESVITL
jgi:uncharacterized protein